MTAAVRAGHHRTWTEDMEGARVHEPATGPGIPTPLTLFFGRDDEIGEVAGLLGRSRLVTLVGAPGAGKTRLAAEVAADAGPGVRFAGLASVSGGRSVPAAVAAALAVDEEPGRPLAETLAEHLAARDLLLVLDNCEHVAGDAADLVSRLLATAPRVRVLATSRVPLSVPGERLFRVPPLGRGPAVELFTDRAGLVGTAAADPERAERICAGLDDLPLAIELAAAWTRVLSPAEVLDRLDAMPSLLVAPGAARHGQRTMEATVEWSLRLLSPDERALFARLSVFTGGFDLRAAEAVAAEPAEPLERLTALIDHSLVLAEPAEDGTTRYRMLEPVRQYGASLLAARGEDEAVRRRHAEHYLGVARRRDAELRGSDRVRPLTELSREEGNLLAALDWARRRPGDLALRLATALAYFWEQRGRVNDGRAWLEELLARAGADRRLRAAALGRLGRLAWRQCDYERARSLHEESLTIMSGLGDEPGTARGLRNLALVATATGDTATAAELCERSIALFRARGDHRGHGWALTVLALARLADGDVGGAEASFLDALALERRGSSAALAACGHLGLALCAAHAGDTGAYRAWLTTLIADIREAGHLLEDPDWLWAASGLATREGRFRAALLLAGAARAASRGGSQMPAQVTEFSAALLVQARRALGRRAADRLLARGARLGTAELMAEALAAPTGADRPLSAREREIADRTGQGLSNEEIAGALHISRRTVETHLENIRLKLGLSSRYEVMAWALTQRLGGEPAGSV
ncbi:LuxR family transcriptional regulator [Actinomadura darangshiensis]|uniref:LuxR family transcriptional regulator n=1 Tax=Actinomadura darangshiensis TaxID=705336 RepID=A0A4R5B4F1_9ACTN|nr:LuxR C-terminal-related transcriptional regulator [Actinomadura darangshiensis]TDD81098.1 LuxR family transcriptional regulator [Actinomadura darangshiensis]